MCVVVETMPPLAEWSVLEAPTSSLGKWLVVQCDCWVGSCHVHAGCSRPIGMVRNAHDIKVSR